MDEGIKPCPFCGGDKILLTRRPCNDKYDMYLCTCFQCGCSLSVLAETREKVVDIWNQRAGDDK